MSLDYEVLDLGLVYYRNAIPNPDYVIDLITDLANKVEQNDKIGTRVSKWDPWWDDHMDKPFCYKFNIFRKSLVSDDDFFKKELYEIDNALYGSLDMVWDHYSNELYPWAGRTAKSEEPNDGVLRYEADGGHLPAHQDLGVSSRLVSTVSYLNQDYDGGEIQFQHSKVSIKPEAGSIVVFPSNYLCVHEVMPITRGTRYAMPHWYHHLETPRMSDGTE